MCLFSRKQEPKIADKDIPVYKCLSISNLAPYVPTYEYHKGMNYAKRPTRDITMKFQWNDEDRTVMEDGKVAYVFDDGWLHSLRPIDTPQAMLDWMRTAMRFTFSRNVAKEIKLVKMYIPKGTKYYEGLDEDYCSECLEWREGASEYPEEEEK